MCVRAQVYVRAGFSLLLLCGLSVTALAAAPKKTTKARYEDFYSRQKALKKFDQQRTNKKADFSQQRRKIEEKREQARKQFIQKRQAHRAEEQEKKAEAWMKEQQKKQDQRREQARKEYVERKQKNLKFVIPEREEFDIHPPPLRKSESSVQRPSQRFRTEETTLRGSGRLRF